MNRKPVVLITGSEGQVGKPLVRGLADDFEVYGLDIVGKPGPQLHLADVSKMEQIRGVFEAIPDVSYLIHLAADHRVDADWESVLKNNIIGTKIVYECAREFGVEKVVFASSNHVTGGYEGFPPTLHESPNPTPVTINDAARPDGDYASSKVFGEAVARQYYDLFGIHSMCLRIGTVVENDDPTIDPTSRFLKTWLSHRDLVQIVKKYLTSDVEFGIYYGVSDNAGRYWDISNATSDLSYVPEDDSSTLAQPIIPGNSA